jgi:two-component system chemotaxis response regulator CheY
MKKILIVDDSNFMRLKLRTLFEENGLMVVGEAINGKDAFNKYKLLTPDIVTMDVTMPDVDGLNGVKLIKQYDSKAKIIMVTAMGQENIVRQCVLSGANGFVVKPFRDELLISNINKL